MTLPPHATRVFKGEIFDVYQWEQELFDGTRATFEMLKRPGTVQVIPVIDGKIVIAREEQPGKPEFLTLLGGRQEEGERALTAAKRELLEESGLESDDWELLRSYRPLAKMDWEISLFAARGCRRVAGQRLDAGERIALLEVTFDEFVAMAMRDEFRSRDFAYELLRMEREGRLGEFRERLFPKG